MITVQNNGKLNEYYGLSTDIKPRGKGINGSCFWEIDTNTLYIYDETNDLWVEVV